MTGGDPLPAWFQLIDAVISALPAAAWWLAAVGYGAWVRHPSLAVRIGVGASVLLVIDMAAGSLGLFGLGHITAVGITLVGALFSWLTFRSNRSDSADSSLWILLGAPAIGCAVVAASSAPQWLWATEFGGYDALSYHLELPREWLALGGIQPLDHCVYSFFPGAMESAFLHLMTLSADAHQAAIPCQWLHLGMLILASAACAESVRITAGRFAGAIAAVFLLGVPWAVVTGTLAYNDMAVVALLGCACVLAMKDPEKPLNWTDHIGFGLLVGVGCAAKLTAAGMSAAPIMALIAVVRPPRQWLTILLSMLGGIALALAPMAVRNAIACGNPVFPFLHHWLGSGHWDAEQFSRWSSAHQFAGGIGERFLALWNEGIRFGIGAAPTRDPWIPQWSLAWIAGPILAIAAILKRPTANGKQIRLWLGLFAMLIMQVAFWMTFTHLKSRFLLPCVIPIAAMAGMGTGRLLNEAPNVVRVLAGLLACAWACVPLVLFSREGGGAPVAAVGRVDGFLGVELLSQNPPPWPEPKLQQLRFEGGPYFTINHTLPPESRVLAEGQAAPFWFSKPINWHTTWDRGPLASWIRASPFDPAEWWSAARGAGFTHVLLDMTMLRIWRRDGWIDPTLDPDAITKSLERHAQRIMAWPDGQILYELRAIQY